MKPRLRTHQFPGDVSRQEKIALLEGRSTRVSASAMKNYKKVVRLKERAVLKREWLRELSASRSAQAPADSTDAPAPCSPDTAAEDR